MVASGKLHLLRSHTGQMERTESQSHNWLKHAACCVSLVVRPPSSRLKLPHRDAFARDFVVFLAPSFLLRSYSRLQCSSTAFGNEISATRCRAQVVFSPLFATTCGVNAGFCFPALLHVFGSGPKEGGPRGGGAFAGIPEFVFNLLVLGQFHLLSFSVNLMLLWNL